MGNDIADKFANEARISGTPVNVRKSKKHIKTRITQYFWETWNHDWQTRGHDSAVHKWINNLKDIPEYFPSSYFQTQILTEHGRFPHYFKKTKKADNNRCYCGERCESFSHYLETCNGTQKLREQFHKSFPRGFSDHIKPEIIKDRGLMSLLEEIAAQVGARLNQV